MSALSATFGTSLPPELADAVSESDEAARELIQRDAASRGRSPSQIEDDIEA